MTTQQKIKNIREACIKANDEIMELKFGCEIYKTSVATCKIIGETPRVFKIITCGGFYKEYFKENIKNFKIIGRPIRLADVLLAMSVIGCMTVGSNQLINITDVNAPDIRWNLKDDNLEHQSEQCLYFIYKIICE